MPLAFSKYVFERMNQILSEEWFSLGESHRWHENGHGVGGTKRKEGHYGRDVQAPVSFQPGLQLPLGDPLLRGET